MILLIGCSKHKHRHLKVGPAVQIYVGSLFVAGMQWAKENAADVWILSAKYGWIRPTTIIHTYNQRLRGAPFFGWPEGDGFYLGGADYFGSAPGRFQPLVPSGNLGEMLSALHRLLRRKPARAKGNRPMANRGVAYSIYRWLLEKPLTRADLKKKVKAAFPHAAESTVDTQLSQARIGNERNCTLHHQGDLWWLTPRKTTLAQSNVAR